MVDIRTRDGRLLSIPMQDVTSGVAFEEIEGLGPVKATLVSSSFALQDGSQYQSARRENRNIIFKMDLYPDFVPESMASLRRRLYSFLMPKSDIRLSFHSDDLPTVDIFGHVETLETPLFSRKTSMQSSILCFDPDFFDPDPVVIEGETTDTELTSVIDYEGSIETGIKFTLNVDRALDEFTIYHKPPDDQLRALTFETPLEAGDVLEISTVSGSKGATLLRDSTLTSVLYGVSPFSNWIELQPGENEYRVYATGDEIPFTIEYVNRYGGL